jgi:hypothetical protein
MSTRETDLLTCPFCGKPPRACPDTSYGYATVFCPDENMCPVAPSADEDLTEGGLSAAVAAWNTRALSSPSQREDLSKLVSRLRERAATASRTSKMLAGAKTARQTDGGFYSGAEPSQTIEWSAADAIASLLNEVEAMREALAEALYLLHEGLTAALPSDEHGWMVRARFQAAHDIIARSTLNRTDKDMDDE